MKVQNFTMLTAYKPNGRLDSDGIAVGEGWDEERKGNVGRAVLDYPNLRLSFWIR